MRATATTAGGEVSRADLEAAAARSGWSITTISPRLLKLTRLGSVLFVADEPASRAEAIERLVLVEKLQQRKRRQL